MKDIVIYGAGSVGRLVEQIILDINKDNLQFNFLGFLDDNASKHNIEINNTLVLGGSDFLEKHPKTLVAVGFSAPSQKKGLVTRLKNLNHERFATLIHPKTWISNRVHIGEGSVIYPGVHLDVDIKIEDFCLLNKLCSVGHDTCIGSFSTISPGVNIGGFNKIYEGVEFGINSCTVQHISIGKWAVVGAGAVIIRDVEENSVVVGNPGKIIRQNPTHQ